MLRVPFWTGAAHIVQFGPIGVPGEVENPAPVQQDFRDGAKQRLHDQHDGPSVQLAEHRRKRHDQDFIVEVVADMQRPIAPVFRALPRDQ